MPLPKKPAANPQTVAGYSNDDLRAMWHWVRGDFEKFLELMNWMETLPNEQKREQFESASWLEKQQREAR